MQLLRYITSKHYVLKLDYTYFDLYHHVHGSLGHDGLDLWHILQFLVHDVSCILKQQGYNTDPRNNVVILYSL